LGSPVTDDESTGHGVLDLREDAAVSSEAVQLASSCAELRERARLAGEHGRFWTLLEQRLELSERLAVTIDSVWLLDSEKVASLTPSGVNGSLLLPLPEGLSDGELAVQIQAMGESRELEPLSEHSLNQLLRRSLSAGETSDDGALGPVIRLTEAEAHASPLVTTKVTLAARASVGGSFTPRQLLPISWVDAETVGPVPLTELRVEFPGFASVDCIVLVCEADWSEIAESITLAVEDLHDRLERGEISDRRAAAVLRVALGPIKDNVCGAVAEFKEAVSRADAGAAWKPVPDDWTADLEAFRSKVDLLKLPRDGEDGFGWVALAAKASEFYDLLRSDRPSFPIRCEVRGGVVQLSARLGDSRSFTVSRVVVPFSTEREPGTQGKRSSVILMTLAVALAGLAMFDRSWLPLSDFGGPTASQVAALADPLVATLLLFPAFLYGQFFQSRPRSDLGNQAQLGTFGILSLLFLMPVLPAALLLVQAPTSLVAFVLALMSAAAAGSSVAVWTVFKAERLQRLRWSAAIWAGPARRRVAD
jgi:hypothetical protein